MCLQSTSLILRALFSIILTIVSSRGIVAISLEVESFHLCKVSIVYKMLNELAVS